MKFVPVKKKLIGRSDGPPAWIRNFAIGTIVFAIVLSQFGQYERGSFLRSHVPYGNSDWFWAFVVLVPAILILGGAIGSHFWELRQASHWVQAPGRIMRSEMAAQRRRSGDDAEKIENAPAIEYEFEAGGGTVRGSRIGIGDDSGGENSEATLKRYPRGATVTVFYDPDDPTNCALERTAAKDLTLAGCLSALALLALFVAAVWLFATRGPDFVRAHFPKATAHPEFIVAITGFGLLVALFWLGLRRMAQQAAKWPVVRGTIVKSTVEEFQSRSSSDRGGATTTLYRPAVEYSYAVHGSDYVGNQIMLMVQTGGSRASAERAAAKYPAGRAVDVHYDPANPGNAALENPGGATWIPLIAALVCFGIAVWAAGVFN